ncbi:MAG: UbiA family prenyltransferase [Pseudomonadota bacterium]
MTEASKPLPLVFDLDGTLIRNDLTHELLVLCMRWYPHLFLLAIFQLIRSRSGGKRWLVERVGDHIHAEHLPYSATALDLIEAHRKTGGDVELVSGSDHELVERIASHLGVFSHAKGSTPPTNLVSSRKADHVAERHPDGFQYAGNSNQDITVWRESKGGYGFNAPSRAFRLKRADDTPIELVRIVEGSGPWRALLKAMRPHQWMKNLLIFMVPCLVISQLGWINGIEVIAGFLCLSLLASGTYIINDLFDIPDDRKHPSKQKRPLASGSLSVPLAGVAALSLVLGSLIGAFFLDITFGFVAASYTVITLAYSFRLKRIVVVDVMVLSCLFGVRVVAGAILVNAPPSIWLLTFIGMFFLSLALTKRYVEVVKMAQKGLVSGRGYRSDDAPVLLAFGVACAVGSVIAFLTYGLLADVRVIENSGIVLSLAGVLIAWLMRLWLLTARGEMNDDPVLFAVKDRTSLLTLMLLTSLVLFETSRPVWQSLF